MSIIHEAWPILALSFLGLCGVVGFIALVSPKMFAVVAETGGLWVTRPKNLSTVDSPIDIDQFVIKNSRQFGALVLMVVCFLTLFFFGRVDPSWTPIFLLFIVSVSICLAFSGLVELGGQVSQIENQLAEGRIDGLTGLANRRAFDDELLRRLSERARRGVDFCVALLDIDHFKEINDKYGHLVGDCVLTKGIAEAIQATKRRMDIAARYGGDEFAIIYPATNLSEASKAVENILAAIAKVRLPADDTTLSITVSIGVAVSAEEDDLSSLVKRADEALYAAKQAGRNRAYRHLGTSCEPARTIQQTEQVEIMTVEHVESN